MEIQIKKLTVDTLELSQRKFGHIQDNYNRKGNSHLVKVSGLRMTVKCFDTYECFSMW